MHSNQISIHNWLGVVSFFFSNRKVPHSFFAVLERRTFKMGPLSVRKHQTNPSLEPRNLGARSGNLQHVTKQSNPFFQFSFERNFSRDDLSGSPSAFASVDCLVLYSGTVVCVPPGRHDGLCMPNLARYPFDKQNCSVRYGSWVHSGEEINFKIPETPVSLGDYVENGDWKLLKVEVVKKEGKFACCPNNTYPSIVYRFIIERHSATHAATIIIPAISKFV